MRRGLERARERLTYANVTATLALFVALGGTSYALTLPRNSVGRAQMRDDSVGRAELRRAAVNSRAIANRSVRLRDMSPSARESLRGLQGPVGPAGPPGPTFSASVNTGGVRMRGNATHTAPAGSNGRVIGFGQPVGHCVATATLAFVAGGAPETPPPTGHITVAPTSDGKVLVRTWNANGGAVALPFNLIVAC